MVFWKSLNPNLKKDLVYLIDLHDAIWEHLFLKYHDKAQYCFSSKLHSIWTKANLFLYKFISLCQLFPKFSKWVPKFFCQFYQSLSHALSWWSYFWWEMKLKSNWKNYFLSLNFVHDKNVSINLLSRCTLFAHWGKFFLTLNLFN